jgi:ketosteroid isomerase-like protein
LSPLEGIERVFAAFLGGDARALFEVIAEDAVWRVPGTVPVAQVYDGRERIFELFRETRRLTDGTYRSELRWAVADDAHAVAVYRASGRRLGRTLDIDQALLIDHRDGIWHAVTAVPTNPAAFEAFWG